MILAESVNSAATGDAVMLIINVIMAIIAFTSAACAILTFNHQKKRSKKAEACRLAAHYANVILKKNAFITSVFSNSGVDKYIKDHVDMREIHEFDRNEMTRILDSNAITCDEFVGKVLEVDPKVIFNCRMTSACSGIERDITFSGYIEVDAETGEKKLCNEAFLVNDFLQEITELLNQLEWFGMNFQYGVADEELLYQSLHKTYLSMVWMLYPIISYNNINNQDKLYTNVIWLFNEWRKRLTMINRKAERKRKRFQKRADKRSAKAKKEQVKAEKEKQKANAVSAEVHKGQPV